MSMTPKTEPGSDRPASKRDRRRRLGPIGIFAVAGLVAIAAGFAVSGGLAYRRDHLGGTARTVTLTYQCGPEDLEWHQPSSQWEWVMTSKASIHERANMPAHFDTEPPHDESPGPGYTVTIHTATGRLHFDSSTTATFTSRAGGKIHMIRRREGTYFTFGCEMINQ